MNIIGRSSALQSVLNAAALIAPTDVSVLITGESGTGKELLAERIHQQSHRAEKTLITVNCGALPENLAESELFGHKRGAFTGANQDRLGRVEAAHQGTLFLDEVGELSMSIQTKLLRFLETGECQTLGVNHPKHMDVRIIAATNRDLLTEAQSGTFRKDLYYRLNVVPLELPPLCERGSKEITLLLEHFIEQMAKQHRVKKPLLSSDVLKILKKYSWPGNVRELKNLCERLVILYQGRTIAKEALSGEFTAQNDTKMDYAELIFSLPEKGLNLAQWEEGMIIQALDRSKGNKSRAARLLGLTRDTLLYRIKKYAIMA
ncbi:sigma-54 interaction domain-containing protein [Magnetococcales bacterium HHB-1]